jgi:hypothetical protein
MTRAEGKIKPDRRAKPVNHARPRATIVVKYLTTNNVLTDETKQNMKQLLALISAIGLLGCAEEQQPVTVANSHYPYSRYSTTTEAYGYASKAYANWTTAQLQKRRLDLYGMVTQTQDRNGVPAYFYHGQPLPQQDEIKAIEVELNRRYKAGDKSAELTPFWPESRRHPATGGRVESF